MTAIRTLALAMLLALSAVPAMAQKVLFKNFSEVTVTGAVSRELSQDNYALIMYNSQYEHEGISDLPVTENDAKAVRKLLEGMGYPSGNITLVENASKSAAKNAVYEFAGKLTSDSSVVIYYSGHGISFSSDNNNYIVPVDLDPVVPGSARELKERIFKDRSLNFNEEVLEVIKFAGPKGVVVFYDACRNSPLGGDDSTKSVGSAASFVPAKIQGTAMFYSARPGQTSLASLNSEKDANLSVYTRVLVSKLAENPTMRLSDLHAVVQSEVSQLAREKAGGHRQHPVFEDELDYSRSDHNEFCLSTVVVNGAPRCTGREGLQQISASSSEASAAFCEAAPIRGTLSGITDLAQLRRERDTYFQCAALRGAIDARIATVNWDSTVATDSCNAYRTYLRNFPSSAHAAKAQEKEAELCKVLSPAELAHHIGVCESVYRNITFGTQIPENDLTRATESCKAASNARPTDYELGFKRAELLLATGRDSDWQQAVELLSSAAISDYPKAAIRLGDYYSADDAGFLTRDLNQALTWYERATKMQNISAPDMVKSLYNIASLYDELGSAHLATDAYRRIVQIERNPRDLLDHARTIPEGRQGRMPPDDLYDLVFNKWNEGQVAFQIGEAWEEGAHGVPNVKKAQQWYERAKNLNYGPADAKLSTVSSSGTSLGSTSAAYDTLLGCLDDAERQLSPRRRLEESESCLTSYLGRASMSAPGRADAAEYLTEVQAELAAYGATNSTPTPTPTPVPQAHPAARFNGSWSGWRGYTDGGRRSPNKECLGRYNFTAEINDGTIRFWSDGRTFSGSVDSNGFVRIDRSGLSPSSKTAFSIEGPLNNARMYSGYCGNGYFKLQL